MKIAFILSTLDNYGPFIVARDIVNNLHQQVQVDVYYIKESKNKLVFNARCIKVNLFTKTDLSNYDVVHSHGFLGDVYLYLNQKSIVGKRLSTMHQEIYTDYSLNYNRFIGEFLEKVWCFVLRKNDLVITLTDEMSIYYENKIKCEKRRIYNGVSPVINLTSITPDDIKILESFKSKFYVIGVSCNLIFRKGVDRIIKALALSTDDIGFLIIGDGHEKEKLINLADELKVKERCLFLGYQSNAVDYFSFFDTYVMSSRSEAFGLCVIEAASQKIPVVCNNLPVYKELFNNGEVIYFDLDNLSTMLNAINQIRENKELYASKIHKKYLQEYTAEKMADNYLTIYVEKKGDICKLQLQ